MLAEKKVEVLHLFDNSLCPEPDIFVFIAFTVLTLLWAVYMSIRSSQPEETSHNRDFSNRFLLSIVYASVLAVQLFDGCWVMVISRWGFSQTGGTNGARHTFLGLMDWMVTFILLTFQYIFLLLGFFLWVITLLRTAKRLFSLWEFGPGRRTTSIRAGKAPLFFSKSFAPGPWEKSWIFWLHKRIKVQYIRATLP